MRRPLLAIVCVAASALIIDAQYPDLRHGRRGDDADPATPADDGERAPHGRAPGRRGLGVHRQGGARRPCPRAYVSLNRGEGGQNIIGPELFDALGSSAPRNCSRRDGSTARNVLRPHLDYGFSKSRAEAATKWGERDHARRLSCASSACQGRSRRLLALQRHAGRRARSPSGGRLSPRSAPRRARMVRTSSEQRRACVTMEAKSSIARKLGQLLGTVVGSAAACSRDVASASEIAGPPDGDRARRPACR